MLKKLPLFVRHTFYYDLKAAILFGIFGGALLPFIAIVGRKIGATEFQIALLMAAPYIANTFALLWTEDVFGTGRVCGMAECYRQGCAHQHVFCYRPVCLYTGHIYIYANNCNSISILRICYEDELP